MMHHIDPFIDNASQVRFFRGSAQGEYEEIQSWIASLPKELTSSEQNQVHVALDLVETHLHRKTKRLFALFMAKSKKEQIQASIQLIQKAKSRVFFNPNQMGEVEARLRFYRDVAPQLGIKKAATYDEMAIKIISAKFWESSHNYAEYEKYMRLFFQGEHILIEEKESFESYDRLRDPATTAKLRGSSHYDHGTLNDKTGGPPPTPRTVGRVENPQYEIEGPQMRCLLFGRAELALDDKGNPLFGKTFTQLCEAAKRKGQPLPQVSKKYTFLQTERAPDSDSIYSINFWKHRVISFFIYKCRKFFRFQKPNVGAYGYGHADTHPTLIKLKSP